MVVGTDRHFNRRFRDIMPHRKSRNESIGSNHLSAKAVLRQAAEAVNHCELLDECFALKSTCRDLVGEGIATLILIMVGITS